MSALDESAFAAPLPSKVVRLGARKRLRTSVSVLKEKDTTTSHVQLMKRLLSELVPHVQYNTFSRDYQFSTANTVRKKVNCSVVQTYGLPLGTLGLFWTSLASASRLAWLNPVERNNTIVFESKRRVKYKNTTNYSLYVHVLRCTSVRDVPDDMNPVQCWSTDVIGNVGGNYFVGPDLNLENGKIYNPRVFDIGGKGTRFSQYWKAGKWERSLLLPGQEVEFVVIDRVAMTRAQYDVLTEDGIVFRTGQKVLIVKVTAESLVTKNAGTENEAEAATLGLSFGGIVEVLEETTSEIKARLYPGFGDNLVAYVSNAVDTAGDAAYGTMVDVGGTTQNNGLTYNVAASGFVAPVIVSNPAGDAEPVAEQALATDEGLSSYRNAMEFGSV